MIYWDVVCCSVLCCAVLCCGVLCYVMLCFYVLRSTVSYGVVLCRVIICRAVLFIASRRETLVGAERLCLAAEFRPAHCNAIKCSILQ